MTDKLPIVIAISIGITFFFVFAYLYDKGVNENIENVHREKLMENLDSEYNWKKIVFCEDEKLTGSLINYVSENQGSLGFRSLKDGKSYNFRGAIRYEDVKLPDGAQKEYNAKLKAILENPVEVTKN